MYNNIEPKANIFGKSRINLPICHSTNAIAASFIEENKLNTHGMVISCDEQTAGKGQRGNRWDAEPYKNLTFSLIVKNDGLDINNAFDMLMTFSLGIYDWLDAKNCEDINIKWPNDIYVKNRKIAGILTENTVKGKWIEYTVIGIGLNVNQTSFSVEGKKPVSLKMLSGKTYRIEDELSSLLYYLEQRWMQLQEKSYERIKKDYLEKLLGYNEKRWFKTSSELFEGEIIGVSQHGLLEIKTENMIKAFNFKEVAFVIE